MLAQLHLILQQDCALDEDRPILVGVSGGPDSLCLLDVLDQLGYRLVIAHVNHRLRPEAEEDARLVAQVAEARSIPFVLGSADVRAYAAVHQLSTEEAARVVRYRFLFDQAKCHQAQAVAVAHNADDQAETVLMHLLRGAGLAGLRGMAYRTLPNAWSETIPLVRPLLGVWRTDVLAYCERRQLKPCFDGTNLDTTFFRNRLRHELIPYLETYNPRVRQVLWRTARSLSADYEMLSGLMEAAWTECILEQGDGWLLLGVVCLLGQSLAVQRSVIRRAVTLLRPALRDLAFDVVERTLDWLVHPPQTGQCDLAAGLRLVWEGERVYLAAWEANLPSMAWPAWPGEPQALPVPGELALAGGWWLRASLETGGVFAVARTNDDPYHTWLAADTSSLLVRTRRPGDRFRPLGMGGASLKLADYFINRKLPRRARQRWPLVCVGDEIAWVPGYHLAHPFRLTETAQQAVHLWLEKETPQA
ncbi:MAG: tRNA lysidine(34) synthetase TilS [Chloroflexota bacterium]